MYTYRYRSDVKFSKVPGGILLMPSDDRSLEVNKTKILVSKRGTYKNYKKHILGDSGADGGDEGKSKRAEKWPFSLLSKH